jgi:hypothetical protein
MERTVLPFPVVAGADAALIAKHFNANPTRYAEARNRVGMTLERAYLQQTPMGDFVIAYIESEKPFRETTQAMLQSDLELDKYFVAHVKEIHGVDMTQPPEGPPPETLAVWSDPAVTTRGRGFAFTAPIIPGTAEAGRAFAKEAYNSEGMTRSRRALGQSLEVATLISTPMGEFVSVYTESEDPVASNEGFAASTDEFDLWFKAECKKLFPEFVDFSKPIPGISEIFDSSALLAPA